MCDAELEFDRPRCSEEFLVALQQSCRLFKDELGRLEAGDTLKLVVRRGNALIPVELPVEKKANDKKPGRKGDKDKKDKPEDEDDE